MITFLPYPDFEKSAKVLDWRRLGKQRPETKQILEINLCKKAGFLTVCLKCGKCSPYNSTPCDCGEMFHEQRYPDEVKIPYENQPAVRMWRTYETYLAIYGMVICGEWISRGYKDNLFDFFDSIYQQGSIDEDCPPWLGREKFHRSHQANLLSKDVKHYFKYFGDYFTNMQQGDYFIEMPYEWNREDWKEFSHE